MADWLNRVGIFLNFLAGFLLSPGLIGTARIRAAEKWSRGQLLALSRRSAKGNTERLQWKSKGIFNVFGPWLFDGVWKSDPDDDQLGPDAERRTWPQGFRGQVCRFLRFNSPPQRL